MPAISSDAFSVGDRVVYGEHPEIAPARPIGTEGVVQRITSHIVEILWKGYSQSVIHILSGSGRCIRKLDDEEEYRNDFA